MQQENLQHKLKNRHVQMIALGGAIGTGLFLGSAEIIRLTGPSIILAYMFCGLVIYAIMRALGEMTVHYPTSGSFVEYARSYLGEGAGFVAGWNAWLLFMTASMMEATAVGKLLDYWVHIPHSLICIVLLGVVCTVNLLGVKYFGEAEFWSAGIKVAAIIFIIVMGAYLIFFNHTVRQIAIANIKKDVQINNLFSHGVEGFFGSMAIVCLSFCGAEFVSVAAGETENPKKTIPKAINGVIIRIILFYVLTMVVIVLMMDTTTLTKISNPFADVFSKIGFSKSAEIINLVAITASISALNSCIYVSSRFLYRLAINGHAPAKLGKLNKKHLPQNAILFTTAAAFISVIINYTFPANVLLYLFAVVTIAIIINWYIILLSHMMFRKKMVEANHEIEYKMPGYPYINVLVMCFLFVLLMVMSKNKDMELSVYVAPAWVFLLSIIHALSVGRKA